MSKPVIFRRGVLSDFGMPIEEFRSSDDSSLYFVEDENTLYKSVGNGKKLVRFSDVQSGFVDGDDLQSKVQRGIEGKLYLTDSGKIYYYANDSWFTITAEADLSAVELIIAELQTKTNTLESKVTTLETTTSTINNTISTIESKVTVLEDNGGNVDITALETKVNTNTSDITTLKNKVNTVENELETTIDKITILQENLGDISALEGQITDLDTRLDNIEAVKKESTLVLINNDISEESISASVEIPYNAKITTIKSVLSNDSGTELNYVIEKSTDGIAWSSVGNVAIPPTEVITLTTLNVNILNGEILRLKVMSINEDVSTLSANIRIEEQ